MRTPVALGFAVLTFLGACSDRDDMYQGARLKPFEAGAQGSLVASDLPPKGTVTREPGPFEDVPHAPWSLATLERGQLQFDIFCAACHARDGYGDGIVPRHGFPSPPTLHDDAARSFSDAYLLDVITNGRGKMPPYGDLIRPADRWAIVGYVRALQLSQHAPPDLVAMGAP